MRGVIAAVALAFLAACSEKQETITVAGKGTAPQAELASLDSVAPETETAVTSAEEPPESVAPPEARPSPPTASAAEPANSDTSESPPTPAADTVTVPAPPDTGPVPARSPETPPVRPAPPPPASPDTVATASPANAPPPSPDGAGVVPAGTQVHVALNDSIHSRRDSAGKVVTARVMQHVTDGAGGVFIPAGAVVQLTVTQLEPAGSRSAADGKLVMRVDGVRAGSELRKIAAEVQGVPHELRGRGVTGGEAGKVGAGAAAGAVAGRVIGGNTKGAVIGAATGAAAGAAVAVHTADRDVVVSARTPIVLVLKTALVATARAY